MQPKVNYGGKKTDLDQIYQSRPMLVEKKSVDDIGRQRLIQCEQKEHFYK